jgi:hypothetical protein
MKTSPDDFPRDLFDEIAEIIPAQYLANYQALVRKLRVLQPTDEILLIVWAVALFILTLDKNRQSILRVLVIQKRMVTEVANALSLLQVRAHMIDRQRSLVALSAQSAKCSAEACTYTLSTQISDVEALLVLIHRMFIVLFAIVFLSSGVTLWMILAKT